MKSLIQVVAVSVISLSLFNSCNTTPEQKTISIHEQMEASATNKKVEASEVLAENKVEVKMGVEGMTCAMGCAKYIEDKVGNMNGVVASVVDFEEKIATFEFDKTVTSPEEIESFINNIHEGQYKAKIATSETILDDEETEGEEETIASVSERIHISFPELFTYFIRRIR